MDTSPEFTEFEHDALTIVVFGASGDLAKKKTLPSLLELHRGGFLPARTQLLGVARSDMTTEQWHEKVSGHLDGPQDEIDDFLSIATYHACQYDDEEALAQILKEGAGELEVCDAGGQPAKCTCCSVQRSIATYSAWLPTSLAGSAAARYAPLPPATHPHSPAGGRHC